MNIKKSGSKKSLGVNAALNALKAMLSIIFPLITYPYALRVLGVENIGKVDFSSSVVNYFLLIAGLGISTYAIREGAILRDESKAFEKFCSELLTINFISSAIAIILLICITIAVPKFHDYTLLLAIQGLQIIGNLIGVVWLYTIEEDFAYITIRAVVVHIIALMMLFAFVHTESDYVCYAATTVVANAGANIFNFFHAKKYVKLRLTRKINIKKHIKPIMIIFGSNVASTIYVNSDKTILGFLTSDYYVGLYSSAVNVYSVLKTCMIAVITVSLPRLSNYYSSNNKDQYIKGAEYIYKMFSVLLFPVVVGIFITSDDIIRILGGDAYAPASSALRLLSISLLFSILATYFTNVVLLPMKMEKDILYATIISAGLNIGLNFLLLGRFKQNGAAFTTLLAEAAMFLYQYYKTKDKFKLKVSAKFNVSLLVGCIGIFLVSFLVDIIVKGFLLNFIGKVLASVTVYCVILVLFKNEMILLAIKKGKNIISRGRI